MITLYHCANARSFRVLWALEEIGLDYELKMLPFPPRFLAREYLEVNPLGTIPYLIDGETRMTESSAICLYLAERYGAAGLKVATDEPAYGAYLNGLFFGEATLTFPQTIVLRYSRLEPEERRLPQAATDYARWFLARLHAVDAIVSGQDYYCAGRFTMADISIGYALLFANALGLDGDFSDALRAYWKRLSTRPAFLAAQAAQEQAGIEQGSGQPALTLRAR
jgi:glutathione S-transferase